MIPVLTKEQAYKLDKNTIESGHLSQEELMDNAGKSLAQFFCEKTDNPFKKKVVVVCGKGNNGGDGVIAHSYLKHYNVSSKIVFTEEKHGHAKLLKKYKISKSEYSIYNNKTKFDKYNWIIDGIFGIGLSRYLNERYQNIIKDLNKNQNIISIDISSGLFTDGDKSKYFINSKHVVTFGYPKLGHYLSPVNSLCFTDIGFQPILSNIEVIEYSDILNIIKPFKKKNDTHKYVKGEVAIQASSYSYPGAGILSAKAAYAAGSSYVTLVIWRSDDVELSDEEYNSLICSMKSTYPDIIIEDERTTMFGSRFNDCNSFLYGPGIVDHTIKNQNNSTVMGDTENYLISLPFSKNVVIDSGGFNSISKIDWYHKNAILTPHIGELKRIFNLKDDVIINIDLLKLIQNNIGNKIIVLKSFNTFIITKDMIYIMDKGPSILATAGTGDVLSGILVSLLSQGYSRLEASILGTYLHAESANYYMNNISKDGMTASDLIDCIPYAFNKLREDSVN